MGTAKKSSLDSTSNKIRNKKFKLFTIEDENSNQKVESTDWFYNDKK